MIRVMRRNRIRKPNHLPEQNEAKSLDGHTCTTQARAADPWINLESVSQKYERWPRSWNAFGLQLTLE
jgi:hypothetical protein